MSYSRRHSQRRSFVTVCPECGKPIEHDAKWCRVCGFTGEKTIPLFGAEAPLLLPILDVAGSLSPGGRRRIQRTIQKLTRRLPQFQWVVACVALPRGTNLSTFAFWLLNVSPLRQGETASMRQWTVLLLFDNTSGEATATAGYQAELWLPENSIKQALLAMRPAFLVGDVARAVCKFLDRLAGDLVTAHRDVTRFEQKGRESQ